MILLPPSSDGSGSGDGSDSPGSVAALPGDDASSGGVAPAAGGREGSSGQGAALGHLPAPVAARLAPLLDGGRVVVARVALQPGSGDALSITLAVVSRRRSGSPEQLAAGEEAPAAGGGGGAGGEAEGDEAAAAGGGAWDAEAAATQEVADAMQAAAAAGAEQLRGTGELLGAAFRQMADRVRCGRGFCACNIPDACFTACICTLPAWKPSPCSLCFTN